MKINPIRRIIQKTGFDFHRFYYKPNRIEILSNLEINTVIDIGANVGQFAQEIRNVLPHAMIHSFEPLHECFLKLEQKFHKDNFFKAWNFALGEKNENAIIQKSEYTPSSSLLPMAEHHKILFPHTIKTTPQSIEKRRLDDIWNSLNVLKNILIKIDTQGYENQVIAGGQDSLRKAAAVIIESSFVEMYENQPLFDEIYEKLKALGFLYHGAIHEKIHPITGEVLFEDSLYIKPNAVIPRQLIQ